MRVRDDVPELLGPNAEETPSSKVCVSVRSNDVESRGTTTRSVPPSTSCSTGIPPWISDDSAEPKLNIVTTKLSLPEALRASVEHNMKGATLIFSVVKGMIERRMSPKSLSGPIGIAQLSGEAAREGASAFIMLMAMISLNLAIFNLLPIPILDGGVIVLLLIEMVMRRDLSLQVKEAVFKLGMVFLMAVVVFVLYNDISKLLPG